MKNYIPPPIYPDDLRAMIFLTSEAIAIGVIMLNLFVGLQLDAALPLGFQILPSASVTD